MPDTIEELLVDHDKLVKISERLGEEVQNLSETTLWFAPFAYSYEKYTSLSVCSSIGDIFSDYHTGMNDISDTLQFEEAIVKQVLEEFETLDTSEGDY